MDECNSLIRACQWDCVGRDSAAPRTADLIVDDATVSTRNDITRSRLKSRSAISPTMVRDAVLLTVGLAGGMDMAEP